MFTQNKVSSSGKGYFPRTVLRSFQIFNVKLILWAFLLGIICKTMEYFANYESGYPVWSKVGVAVICIPVALLGKWMEKKAEAHFDSKIRKTLADD